MRYSFVTLIAVTFMSTFALGATMDQLAATKHNFTNPASPYKVLLGNSTTCQPCHTPHHAIVDATGAQDIKISGRLWNHAMSEATYTLYEGDTAAFTTNTDGSQGMDRVSRLCLGCHDGSVALDAFGMDPAGTGNRFAGTVKFAAGAVANLGIDFRDDHPVGIDAQAATASGAPVGFLKTPTVTYNTTGDPTSGIKSVQFPVFNFASQTLPVYTITGSTGYFVSCKSCHTPHGTGLASLTPYPNLLNCDPAYLCNSCHYK